MNHAYNRLRDFCDFLYLCQIQKTKVLSVGFFSKCHTKPLKNLKIQNSTLLKSEIILMCTDLPVSWHAFDLYSVYNSDLDLKDSGT